MCAVRVCPVPTAVLSSDNCVLKCWRVHKLVHTAYREGEAPPGLAVPLSRHLCAHPAICAPGTNADLRPK